MVYLMCPYLHTHIDAYMHTCMHSSMHTSMYTSMYTSTHACMHTHTCIDIPTEYTTLPRSLSLTVSFSFLWL